MRAGWWEATAGMVCSFLLVVTVVCFILFSSLSWYDLSFFVLLPEARLPDCQVLMMLLFGQGVSGGLHF